MDNIAGRSAPSGRTTSMVTEVSPTTMSAKSTVRISPGGTVPSALCPTFTNMPSESALKTTPSITSPRRRGLGCSIESRSVPMSSIAPAPSSCSVICLFSPPF